MRFSVIRLSALFLLLGGIEVVCNSNAYAIELECGQRKATTASANFTFESEDSLACELDCLLTDYKDHATLNEQITCKQDQDRCAPVITGAKQSNLQHYFIPPIPQFKPAQEQSAVQAPGDCKCSADLEVTVQCAPNGEVRRPRPEPEIQESPVTCCEYKIPDYARPGFLERLSQGALTIGAYTREGALVATFCSDGQAYGTFESGMGAERFRIEWAHWHGFIGWIERDGFEPLDGATGFGGGLCWTF